MIKEIIEKYQLIPHPEGGYFREVYRSEQVLSSPASNEKRNALTHIYFLLTKGQVSRFHKVVHDEIWNFYEGSPLKLIQYDGENIEEFILGKDEFYHVVPGGIYQAAETKGEYTLVGCSVAPGFDFKDFSFMDKDSQDFEIINNKLSEYLKYI